MNRNRHTLIKTLSILLITLLLLGCRSEKKKVNVSPEEKIRGTESVVDLGLIYQKEKVMLLSEIKGVDFDTLYPLLKDYLVATYGYEYSSKVQPGQYKDAVKQLSMKYGIPRKKIASLVFSFKYEMQTTEDILDHLEEEKRMFEDLKDSSY